MPLIQPPPSPLPTHVLNFPLFPPTPLKCTVCRSSVSGSILWYADHCHVWDVWMDGENISLRRVLLPCCSNCFPSSLTLSLALSLSVCLSVCLSFSLSLPPLLIQYIYARPNQLEVFKGAVIPWCQNCTNQAVQQGLGVVGAVIMPHNLYLHSGLVLVSVESVTIIVCD